MIARTLHLQDVKPDNFLFLNKSENSPLKATDFGLAVRWNPTDPPLTSRSGTPAYMVSCQRDARCLPELVLTPPVHHPGLPCQAPEVIKQKYDYRCDVWSAGVLMYQLLTGRWPFFDDLRNVTLPQVFR